MGSSKGGRLALAVAVAGLATIAAVLYLLRTEVLEWVRDEIIDPVRLDVADRGVKEKILERHTIGFAEGTPLVDALKVLSAISGLNMVLTKEAARIVKERSPTVSLPEERDVPLRKILDRVLRASGDANFRSAIRSGALYIGPPESLP